MALEKEMETYGAKLPELKEHLAILGISDRALIGILQRGKGSSVSHVVEHPIEYGGGDLFGRELVGLRDALLSK